MTEGKRAPNLLPAILVLGVLLWIFTMTGGRQVFVKEILERPTIPRRSTFFGAIREWNMGRSGMKP